MSVHDRTNPSIEEVADGIISYIKKYMVANTPLIQSAVVGNTTLQVENTLRFSRGDQIIVFDNNHVFNPDRGEYEGMELCTVKYDPISTTELVLEQAIQGSYSLTDYGRIQKAYKGAILLEKDVLYGDREVIPFNQVAICVEPDSLSGEWIALRVLSNEFRCSILVYVKPMGGNTEEEVSSGQEWAARVCHAYASELYDMFLSNIHMDLLIDEVPLTADAQAGDSFVYIGTSVGDQWPSDGEGRYEVQDNFHSEILHSIISPVSSSSSDSTVESPDLSSSSVNSSSSSINSSSSCSFDSSSESSKSSESTSSSSSSSLNSSSTTGNSSSSSVSSMSEETETSISSMSSMGEGKYIIWLNSPLEHNYRVRDKAVLRRKIRYMYDSRASDLTFGLTQKGGVMIKGASMNWFGKESQLYNFPQVGKGGMN